jgi:diguanylate cyclase (GGDEF)-like protein
MLARFRFAYRYGGEEFTIILPMTTKEDAVSTAQRIQNEFRKEVIYPPAGKEIFVTMSIGCLANIYRKKR